MIIETLEYIHRLLIDDVSEKENSLEKAEKKFSSLSKVNVCLDIILPQEDTELVNAERELYCAEEKLNEAKKALEAFESREF